MTVFSGSGEDFNVVFPLFVFGAFVTVHGHAFEVLCHEIHGLKNGRRFSETSVVFYRRSDADTGTTFAVDYHIV